jgi:hypothetical protein
VQLAREESAQLEIRAREMIAKSSVESDVRQTAQLELARAQVGRHSHLRVSSIRLRNRRVYCVPAAE